VRGFNNDAARSTTAPRGDDVNLAILHRIMGGVVIVCIILCLGMMVGIVYNAENRPAPTYACPSPQLLVFPSGMPGGVIVIQSC
jgi:hypothetical protein